MSAQSSKENPMKASRERARIQDIPIHCITLQTFTKIQWIIVLFCLIESIVMQAEKAF